MAVPITPPVGDTRPASDAPTEHLLAAFRRDVLLATGRAATVRPAGSGDVEAIRSFYAGLGEASTYNRFFGVRPSIPEEELRRATVQDVRTHVMLLAEDSGRVIGLGEYHARPGADEAEVAFAVADDHHHQGVATVLLEDLAEIARVTGFRRLVAETLPGNAGMLAVFRDVGLVQRQWFETGVVQVQLDLTADDVLQDHADLRDWQAAVRSLQPIVAPGHVVVIGAGRDPASPGRRILAHLRESYTGRVSVVHPTRASVGDVTAVPSVDQLDTVPDLAVIAVPADAVAEVVDCCGAAGVAAAVVVSAGFAEVGGDGARLQDEVLAAARLHGMRIIGPNCLGVVSTKCGLNTTFTSQRFLPGRIAIASQSGGVGIAIAAEAERRQAGVSSFVSMGNKADVSGNDLLRLWADDDATRVVLLYLESFGDPIRFARIARAVSLRKPIVALTSGATAPGRRGAMSHTAAIAGDRAAVDALFAHTGVIRARTLEELIDVGLLLERQPSPRGNRVALIGNAGGPLILGADAADDGGLEVPQLSDELQRRLAELVPTAAALVNPVDLGASATPAELAAVVRCVAGSGEVDACVIVVVEVDGSALDATTVALDSIEVDVPLAASVIGGGERPSRTIPAFPTPERAAMSVAAVCRRARWLDRAAVAGDRAAMVEPNELVTARRLARQHVEGAGTTWLAPGPAFELLESAGIPMAPWRVVQSADDCARAVDELGAPCAVKADVRDLLHKSDVGGVVLGVVNGRRAAEVYRDFETRFGERLVAAVVQTQLAPGLEMLVGAVRDKRFGPFVIVGAGGVEAELRDDRAVLVAPVACAEARRAVEGLHLAPLFHGFRGRPALPLDTVVELVAAVAGLAAEVPEIEQLDLNPVVVGPGGVTVVDALIGVSRPGSPVVPARGLRGGSGARR